MTPGRIAIDLPWPPSQNSIWRSRGNRVYRSPKYVSWLKEAGWVVKRFQMENQFPFIEGEFSATIVLNPPDKRKIDVDNRIKVLLDLAEKTGLIENDNFCRLLVVSYGDRATTGSAKLTLATMASGGVSHETQDPVACRID